MTTTGRWLAAACVSVFLFAVARGQDAAPKLPVPESAEQSAALKVLKKEFQQELRSKDPADQRALATRLMERAEAAEDDPAGRFVSLSIAAGSAANAHDVALAMQAVDRLCTVFEAPRADLGAATIERCAKGTKDAGVLAAVAMTAVDLTGVGLNEGDAAAAGKCIALAKKHAKSAKMDGVAARAGELSKLVSAFKRLAAAAKSAESTLAENREDEAAHEALGRYLCFGRGDWEAGAAHLDKLPSGAAPLGIPHLLSLERENATTPAERLVLAESWWTVAEAEKDVLAAARMRAKAHGWYSGLGDDLPDERKDEVQARLAAVTYTAWDGGVALTTDFSKYGPANLALGTIRDFIRREKIDTDGSGWRTKLPRFPDVSFAPGVDYRWHLETSEGDMTLRFFPDTAPNHVANFLYLTELGFFDGLKFHRVINDFMAQGGCPTGTGSGGPGYFFESEFAGGLEHDRPGLLSMANTGTPKSDGSQFFITFKPYPSLNGKHTIFGELIDGEDVLKKLEAVGTPGGTPTKTITIERATISVR